MAWLTGYPREKVDWAPIVDQDKCVKCGMCMNCGKKVFEWTRNGPKVVRPEVCVVGCRTCGNLCMSNAITFPDIANLRDLYRREGIWAKVKTQLQEEGKLAAAGP
ncbi:MAG: ferredoxin family protein [Planctomycetes bacterium]|nr:ferredoxin family protein [Planctomycetota bacterium]